MGRLDKDTEGLLLITDVYKRQWLPRMAKEQGADFDAHPNSEVTEYIYDMADRMAAADLIVCRAGAATLGELCMLCLLYTSQSRSADACAA